MTGDDVGYPASLLWAHQLKREHAYLLERLKALETKPTTQTGDSVLLREAKTLLDAVKEEQGKLQKDVATLQGDFSNIREEYTKFNSQKEIMLHGNAKIYNDVAAAAALAAEANQKGLNIETKLNSFDLTVKEKFEVVNHELAGMEVLRNTVDRNNGLYDELEVRVFNLESHVDQSNELLTKVNNTMAGFEAKLSAHQEHGVEQRAFAQDGKSKNQSVQLARFDPLQRGQSPVLQSQHNRPNPSLFPLRPSHVRQLSQTAIQNAEDLDVLDLESSPSFQRGRPKSYRLQRYSAVENNPSITFKLEPTQLTATPSPHDKVQNDCAAIVQHLEEQGVEPIPLNSPVAASKGIAKRDKTNKKYKASDASYLANAASTAISMGIDKGFTARPPTETDLELSARPITLPQAPQNTQKDQLDISGMRLGDSSGTSKAEMAPTKSSERELAKAISSHAPPKIKMKKTKSASALVTTRQTRSKTKATDAVSIPKPEIGLLDGSAQLLSADVDQISHINNENIAPRYTFQSKRGANPSFMERITNKRQRIDTANPTPLSDFEEESPTNTITRKGGVHKHRDAEANAIVIDSMDAMKADSAKQGKSARPLGGKVSKIVKGKPRAKRPVKQIV